MSRFSQSWVPLQVLLLPSQLLSFVVGLTHAQAWNLPGSICSVCLCSAWAWLTWNLVSGWLGAALLPMLSVLSWSLAPLLKVSLAQSMPANLAVSGWTPGISNDNSFKMIQGPVGWVVKYTTMDHVYDGLGLVSWYDIYEMKYWRRTPIDLSSKLSKTSRSKYILYRFITTEWECIIPRWNFWCHRVHDTSWSAHIRLRCWRFNLILVWPTMQLGCELAGGIGALQSLHRSIPGSQLLSSFAHFLWPLAFRSWQIHGSELYG